MGFQRIQLCGTAISKRREWNRESGLQESQDAEAGEVGNQRCRDLQDHEEEQGDDVDRSATNGGNFWRCEASMRSSTKA